MKAFKLFCIVLFVSFEYLNAQGNKDLTIGGELFSDQRVLLKSPNNWVWNENRLDLKLEKKVEGFARFYGNVWLRNIGTPQSSGLSDLYNKNIVDPYNLEIREAYVQLYSFLFKDLDLSIGKQRIAWGTGDKLNPSDNINPHDLEDIFDFGRHRGSWSLNMLYYLNNEYSLQTVFVPFFQPANLPVGAFSNVFTTMPGLPTGMDPTSINDTLLLPAINLGESSTFALKFKGFAANFDFSISYIWGIDGIAFPTNNSLIIQDTLFNTTVNSQLNFSRNHIIGADIAGSIGSIGVWAEAAVFIPEKEIVMSTNISATFQLPFGFPRLDTTLLKKEPYVKYVLGLDYTFFDGSYLNFQYLHGFIHERGREALNDYFLIRYEKKFFNEKLTLAPLAGGVIVSDWNETSNNYALLYTPELRYQASDNAELSLSAYVFNGKGNNPFANLNNLDMIRLGFKYSF